MTENNPQEQVKQLLQELAKYPDYDRLLLPMKLCKELHIETTPIETLSVKEYLQANKKSQFTDYDSFEIRKSDGIIREFKPMNEVKLITCKPEEIDTIINQTSQQTSEQPCEELVLPKESNGSTNLESVD